MLPLSKVEPVQDVLEWPEPSRASQGTALVSVIVPTLNEAENIDSLLAAILRESGSGIQFEVLIADGGSTDGTIDCALAWEERGQVRLVRGDGRRSLAGDVLKAAALARADVVVVMDGDLSHPPDRLCALVRPVLDGSSDMVLGSRFVSGGATSGWPLWRKMLSRLGAALARPLTDVSDPMSGFFAVRRERLMAVDPQAAGFKIGLEIIAAGGDSLTVEEIPIVFADRVHGKSKLGTAALVAYLHRLLILAGGQVSAGSPARFAAVGLSGVFVDLLAFQALTLFGTSMAAANLASFCSAMVWNYFFNAHWVFAGDKSTLPKRTGELYGRFFLICLLALAIRGGILAAGVDMLGIAPQAALLCAIGTAAVVSYLGSAFFVFPATDVRVSNAVHWRIAAVGVAAYAIVLRLLFLGLIDLLPQEAYYWNYAQHLDIGYLDHPPMVAWLIWATTALFGDNEFGVRFSAWLCWFVTACFSFTLTRRMFGRSAAFVGLLLVAAVPFFFATGFLMTPDAPLTAAWAGTLYFLARALIDDRRSAWLGVGICLGLGMLSKYTIVLLVPATVLFMLSDARARRWLKRPQPYLAAGVALLLVSPVIYWNVENGLASFAFQSSRRFALSFRFSLPTLVAYAALLLTPLGLTLISSALWTQCQRRGTRRMKEDDRHVVRFVIVFTLMPLIVFIAFSLIREVKLNWIGPLWLAALPAASVAMLDIAWRTSAVDNAIRRLWTSTISVTLVVYGLLLNHLVMGMPGFGYLLSLPAMPVAWSEFGREAADLAREVQQETGQEPLLIGLDTYNVASALAFYAMGDTDKAGNSVGRGILGMPSLMYGYWYRPEPLHGRPAIVFAMKQNQIENYAADRYFSVVSASRVKSIVKDGMPAGRFYYRVGYEYRGN